MDRNKIFALVLIVLAVIIFIINRRAVEVNILLTTIRSIQSFVFLGFTALGVVIGVLLK